MCRAQPPSPRSRKPAFYTQQRPHGQSRAAGTRRHVSQAGRRGEAWTAEASRPALVRRAFTAVIRRPTLKMDVFARGVRHCSVCWVATVGRFTLRAGSCSLHPAAGADASGSDNGLSVLTNRHRKPARAAMTAATTTTNCPPIFP